MPSTALKIIPLITNEKDHAILIADPNFIKQYVALLEPLNTKFRLCDISYPGIHQALFTYIIGYNFGETFIVLKLIDDLMTDYQGDINLAWQTGVKTITDNLFKQVNLATYVVTEAIISTALKVLVNRLLSGKKINSQFIIDRINSFKKERTDLENIKKALPARNAYRFFHPRMAAKVDAMLEEIIIAEKEYKKATSTALTYNEALTIFLAEELLADHKFSTIQEAVKYLETFSRENDPSIKYETCLGVLNRADNLINDYYNNTVIEYVEPDFPI